MFTKRTIKRERRVTSVDTRPKRWQWLILCCHSGTMKKKQ